MQERLEQILVTVPPADGRAIDGLANLAHACRLYRSPGLVEGQARFFPLKAAMPYHGASLAGEIGDHVFIAYLEHDACWQHGAPMLHQSVVAAVSTGSRLVWMIRAFGSTR